MRDGHIHTRTNNSGGIQGGIAIGEPILLRVAFKPTATIAKPQETVTAQGEATTLAAKGDTIPVCCHAPRRWRKPWWRWCWWIITCATKPSVANGGPLPELANVERRWPLSDCN